MFSQSTWPFFFLWWETFKIFSLSNFQICSTILFIIVTISSVQFSSVTQSCPSLCDPVNRSTPSLPVHHQFPEFTQTHIHWVSDAIQPCHPLSSPSPPAPNLSQHQSLFQWVNSSHEVAKVLEFQLEHHSFQRNPRADLLQNGLVGSPGSPRDSQESSPTPQFKSQENKWPEMYIHSKKNVKHEGKNDSKFAYFCFISILAGGFSLSFRKWLVK